MSSAGEMGVKNRQELASLGFTALMRRGLGALPTRGLALDQARKLGAALGELLGTIMLEGTIVPESVRTNRGAIFGKPTSRFIKKSLAGGTWRALWPFAIYPLESLGELPPALQ